MSHLEAQPQSTENIAHHLLVEANSNHDVMRELGDLQKQDPTKYNAVLKEMSAQEQTLPKEFQHTLTIYGDDNKLEIQQTSHDMSKGTLQDLEKGAHQRAAHIIDGAKSGESVTATAQQGSLFEQRMVAGDILAYKQAHPGQLPLLEVAGMDQGVPIVLQGTKGEYGMEISKALVQAQKQSVEDKIHRYQHPEEEAQQIETVAAKALKGDEYSKATLENMGQRLQLENDTYRRAVVEKIGADGNQHSYKNPAPHAEITRDEKGDPTEIVFTKNFNMPVLGAKHTLDVRSGAQYQHDEIAKLDNEIAEKTKGWTGQHGQKGMEEAVHKYIQDHDGPESAEAKRNQMGH